MTQEPDNTEPRIEIRIQTEPIDVAAEYAAAASPQSGGRCVFAGCVRPDEDGRTIDHLEYEHYAGMAEKELRLLAAEACRRWELHALRLVHRVGSIPVGAEAVVIVTAHGHRAATFDSARFMIEELKRKVPIWKAAPSD